MTFFLKLARRQNSLKQIKTLNTSTWCHFLSTLAIQNIQSYQEEVINHFAKFSIKLLHKICETTHAACCPYTPNTSVTPIFPNMRVLNKVLKLFGNWKDNEATIIEKLQPLSTHSIFVYFFACIRQTGATSRMSSFTLNWKLKLQRSRMKKISNLSKLLLKISWIFKCQVANRY